MYPAQVVLPQARGGADDRGRDPPRARARTSTSCSPAFDAAGRRRRSLHDHRQPAGQLDLVRLRRSWRSAPASRCCPSARSRSPSAKLPAEAAATTTAAAARAAAARRPRAARSTSQTARRPCRVVAARRRSSSELQHEIICMCGTCGRAAAVRRVPRAARPHEMRDELAALVDEGQDARRRSSQYFVAEVRQPGAAGRADRQGLQPPRVAVPVRRSASRRRARSASSRCAGRAARQRATRPQPPADADDARARARLDDELRDLD